MVYVRPGRPSEKAARLNAAVHCGAGLALVDDKARAILRHDCALNVSLFGQLRRRKTQPILPLPDLATLSACARCGSEIRPGDRGPIDAQRTVYLHVPTDIRRENRVERDLAQRDGYGNAEAIRQSFNSRIESQYYPYTLPEAGRSDLLITVVARREDGYIYPYRYSYDVYEKTGKNCRL